MRIRCIVRNMRQQVRRAKQKAWRAGHWSGMMAGLGMVEQRLNEGHDFAQAIKLARTDIEILYPTLVGELEEVE